MKRVRGALLLCFCLLLSGCGASAETGGMEAIEEPDDDKAMLDAAPIAQVEGEAISPDGRFEVRAEGASGQYISGIQPPEFLQIVDRESGEILWQDQGWLSQSALWSPDGAYVALAYSARTWNAVRFLETENWTDWDFALPNGDPIPEYEFLPEDWGVWRTDHSMDLTVGYGDGHPQHTYNCIVSLEDGTLTGRSWEITKESLPGNYDFNHDGVAETVELTTVWFSGLTGAAAECYELRILDQNGGVLWQDEAGTSHAGENSIYACQVEGKDYLLRYRPYMQQGVATYSYDLFSLDGEGNAISYQGGQVEFSVDGSMYALVGFDVEKIGAFLREVHGYLDAGTLLVSTAPGDDMFFFNYDNGVSLTENLQRHKDQLEECWQETSGR